MSKMSAISFSHLPEHSPPVPNPGPLGDGVEEGCLWRCCEASLQEHRPPFTPGALGLGADLGLRSRVKSVTPCGANQVMSSVKSPEVFLPH